MRTRQLSFVSVVFDAEVDLLRLQARSMAIWLDPECVAEIIVVDNCVLGMLPIQRRHLLRAYGQFAHKVRVRRVRDIVGAREIDGWRVQQAAKLCASRDITTRHFVVLDAKNHFIARAGYADFVAEDGRALGGMHGYAGHPLQRDLESTLSYLGADTDVVNASLESFPPTAPPFVIQTDIARSLITDLESRSGRSFADEFAHAGLLEFFLYSGWILVRGPGLEAVWNAVSIPSPTVWPKSTTEAGVVRAIDEAVSSSATVFGVHRRAIFRGDLAARSRIAEFWTARGLFHTQKDAEAFMTLVRRRYLPAMVATRGIERGRALALRMRPAKK